MITEADLLVLGFTKQYSNLSGGFYHRVVSDNFYLTVDFATLTPSLHVAGYGHIQKLPHIETARQIRNLVFSLSGVYIP